ncbi:hypothetical protein SO802_001844 [Lithocarpus litseifolius]|uniref:Zinc knuckle CX2CX4HX4C domain-containing protein n=1 Tax=Lithocarpus litseifolius TaxID=425828 RepID=A0AAW2DVI6_9ROSI
MRVRVKIDPWLLVIVGFMLRLDDELRVWIRCRYKKVHKLCTKCGLIGHTQGQCTHCMEDIEIMLYRQRLRIQDLHQVQYKFDALQPQFSNDLRAFHNHRRRWTTQIREPVNLPNAGFRDNTDTLNPNPSLNQPNISANNASFSMRPPWLPHDESNLKWTWIEGSGPFITNGLTTHPQFKASGFESDTTVVMYNLDKLNEERPKAMQDQGLAKGCIPKSSDSFIESLVQRVNCGRFRFELEGSSHGPSMIDPNTREAHVRIDLGSNNNNYE